MTALSFTKQPSGRVRPEGYVGSYGSAVELSGGKVLLLRVSQAPDGSRRISGRTVARFSLVESL